MLPQVLLVLCRVQALAHLFRHPSWVVERCHGAWAAVWRLIHLIRRKSGKNSRQTGHWPLHGLMGEIIIRCTPANHHSYHNGPEPQTGSNNFPVCRHQVQITRVGGHSSDDSLVFVLYCPGPKAKLMVRNHCAKQYLSGPRILKQMCKRFAQIVLPLFLMS